MQTKLKHQKFCTGHRFCGFAQQFIESDFDDWVKSAAGSSDNPKRVLPPSNGKPSPELNQITQQGIDDWLAQSINRSLGSMLNPQKKYKLPEGYEEQLRKRYPQQRKQLFVSNYYNELYFKPARGTKSMVRKKILAAQDLKYDSSLLVPRTDIPGIPIVIRQRRYKTGIKAAQSGGKRKNHSKSGSSQQKKPESKPSPPKAPLPELVSKHFYLNFDNFTKSSQNKLETKPSEQEAANWKKKSIASRPISASEVKAEIRQTSASLRKTLEERVKLLMSQTEVESGKNYHNLQYQVKIVKQTGDREQRASYWFNLGNEGCQAGSLDVAQSCFMQALELQPLFMEACYNLGCLNLKKRILVTAKKWFSLALQFKSRPNEVFIALALVSFMLRQYQASNAYLASAEQAGVKLPICSYLRAVNYKSQHNYAKAGLHYNQLAKDQIAPQGRVFLGLLLATACCRNKKIPISLVPALRSAVAVKEMLRESEQPISQSIAKLPFLIRFDPAVAKRLYQHGELTSFQEGQTMFINQQAAGIVLSGQAVTLDHQLNFKSPTIFEKLKPGTLFGASTQDGNLSSNANLWTICKKKAVILVIRRPVFDDFWKGQYDFNSDGLYFRLRNLPIFKNVSQKALCDMVEHGQVTKCEPNTIIFNDHTYRLRSKDFKFEEDREESFSQGNKLRKFKNWKTPGLVVVLSGIGVLQNPIGMKLEGYLTCGTVIGENLLVHFRGLSSYGLARATTELTYWLLRDKHFYVLNERDRTMVLQNCRQRREMAELDYMFRLAAEGSLSKKAN